MSLDWPTLQALIDAGDTAGVATAVRDLDDRQRRALAGPLREYKRRWLDLPWYDGHGRFDPPARQSGPLLLAGAGCVSGVSALARWLCDLSMWLDRHNDDNQRRLAVETLQARSAPALADLSRHLAARLRPDDTHVAALVMTLVAASGVEPPATEGFVAGWTWTVRRAAAGDGVGAALVDALRGDPLRPVMVPMLFDVDGAGPYLRPDWPAALAALAVDGVQDRVRLLDGCMGRLLRGGRPGEIGLFLQVHEELDPSVDEVAARVRDYVRLLPDTLSTVARMCQRQLRRLDDAGRLEFGTFLESSRAVLSRTEKNLATTQLSWLDTVARRDRGRVSDIVAAVAVAGEHPGSDIRQKAAALIARHASAASAVASVPGVERPAALPAPAAPPPVQPPLGSPAELAEEIAAALAQPLTAASFERILDGLVRFAYADADGLSVALGPLRDRLDWHVSMGGDNEVFPRLAAAAQALADPASQAARPAPSATGPATVDTAAVAGPYDIVMARVTEIAARAGREPIPNLVAGPTSSDGHLDPGELVARLAAAEAAGWQPWPWDLFQALLRLPRTDDPDINRDTARQAARLVSPAGRRLMGWLAGGGARDPDAAAVLVDYGPYRQYRDRDRPSHRYLVTLTPSPEPPGADSHPQFELSVPQAMARWLSAGGDSIPLWPAALPAHREVVAAHVLPFIAAAADMDNYADPVAVLPSLAECSGPVGPALTLGLAYGLAAKEHAGRAAAVDALLLLSARGQLDSAALGTRIGALASLGPVRLNRAAPALQDAARAGAYPQVWAAVAAAVPYLLPPACDKPPNRLADLLTLGVETATWAGAHDTIPTLAAYAGRGGSTRIATEARRLHQLLTGTPDRPGSRAVSAR